MAAATTRKPIFIEDDDGLTSHSDMETGFSANHRLFTKSSSFNAYRVLPSAASPRFRCEENHQPHFLEACSLCKKPLGDNRDIFMYRGDTPFCSEECRQEQIYIDEANEKKWNLSASVKAVRIDQNKSSSNNTEVYPIRTRTVAAA